MRCSKSAVALVFVALSFSALSARDAAASGAAGSVRPPGTVDSHPPPSPPPLTDPRSNTASLAPLPSPRPPAEGEVSADTTRMTVHQENLHWTRATTFARVAGQWQVASDVLTAKPPLRCGANPPECDTLPQ